MSENRKMEEFILYLRSQSDWKQAAATALFMNLYLLPLGHPASRGQRSGKLKVQQSHFWIQPLFLLGRSKSRCSVQ